LLVGINLVVALAASVAPILLGRLLLATHLGHPTLFSLVGGVTGLLLVAIGTLNAFDTIIASCVVLLAITLLIHRLVWPVMGNLIQVLADEHILLKRWPLFFTGVAVLGAAWPAFDVFVKLLGR
jgi:hypothetical protein